MRDKWIINAKKIVCLIGLRNVKRRDETKKKTKGTIEVTDRPIKNEIQSNK